MDPITYSLKNPDSGAFCRRLSSFTDETVSTAGHILGDLPDDYRSWLDGEAREKLRTREEYLFDILTLGILRRLYGGRALSTSPLISRLLAGLYESRRRLRPLKPAIDIIRGLLATIFLAKERGDALWRDGDHVRNLRHLIGWLAATGEYREEVKRLKLFLGWIETLSVSRQSAVLESIDCSARWFEDSAERAFGAYTRNVDRFLREDLPYHQWREDIIFCGRREVEYHLAMLSVEIMNRAYREAFIATSRKALLLPACMRLRSAEDCQARRISLDMACSGCSNICAINRYTRLGREHGFSVHIIPHSSDFTAWLKTWAAGQDVGVIGVACLLNLITGGLELKSLDIPAQCIPLDYCGCSAHWHETGIITAFAERELLRILEIGSPVEA